MILLLINIDIRIYNTHNSAVNTQAVTFHSELGVGFGIGGWEVHGSCHVHADIVEDQHVSGSLLLDLNILDGRTNIDMKVSLIQHLENLMQSFPWESIKYIPISSRLFFVEKSDPFDWGRLVAIAVVLYDLCTFLMSFHLHIICSRGTLTADWCRASPFSFQLPWTSSSDISVSNLAVSVSVTSTLYSGRTTLMSRSAGATRETYLGMNSESEVNPLKTVIFICFCPELLELDSADSIWSK